MKINHCFLDIFKIKLLNRDRLVAFLRLMSETQYADTEVEELLTMLKETENLEEEGDILQYLVDTQGLQFSTGIFIFLNLFFFSN